MFTLLSVFTLLYLHYIHCFLLSLHACCSRVQVYGTTFMNKFYIFYSHTEWYLLSTVSWDRLCFSWGSAIKLNTIHYMLYKIMCNPMHPQNGVGSLPYMPVRVTRSVLIAHRYTYAPLLCRTSQYHRTFISLSLILWNELTNPAFHGVGLAGLNNRANAFLLS